LPDDNGGRASGASTNAGGAVGTKVVLTTTVVGWIQSHIRCSAARGKTLLA
jgi:hypothetical protein